MCMKEFKNSKNEIPKRPENNFIIQALLFLFTVGIGNLIYSVCILIRQKKWDILYGADSSYCFQKHTPLVIVLVISLIMTTNIVMGLTLGGLDAAGVIEIPEYEYEHNKGDSYTTCSICHKRVKEKYAVGYYCQSCYRKLHEIR